MVVRQSTDLTANFITTTRGLRTTTPARTVVDLAATLRPRQLERVVGQCLVTKCVGWDELIEVFDLLARKGKPGIQLLRAILAERGPGLAMVESVLELEIVKLLVAAGLPNPILQYSLQWRTAAVGRVDLAYPHARLIIEADGRWHTQSDRFESDRRRDNLAQLAGWRVRRFTWQDLIERPHEIVRMVREALAVGGTPLAG